VRAEIDAGGTHRTAAVLRGRTGPADLRIDGVGDRRQSEVAALLPVHVVLPSVSDLVFGPPAERRRFLDWGVFHVEHSYIEALRRATRIIRQRNQLLRRVSAGNESIRALEAWSSPLEAAEDRVTESRRRYLDRWLPVFTEILEALEPGLSVVIEFDPGWRGESYGVVLGDGLSAEVKWGSTRYGPHRADLRMTVAGGGAGSMLSRGQGKLVAQAMILAQIEVLGRSGGRRGILLVDDLAAEMDSERSTRLMARMAASGAQVVATTVGSVTGWSWPNGPGRVFHVKQGVVAPS
jgi:DNA replication and repair protein RecF